MIATLLQKTADVWVHWAIVHLLESTLMLAVVLAVWGLIRKRCPQNVGYVLFLLVMVKLLVPVGVPMPEFLAKYTLSYRISQVLVNHETSREINRERNMVPDMPKPSVLPVFSEPVPVSSQEFTPVTDTFVTDSPIVFDPMTSPAPLIVPETKTEPVVMPEPVLSSENMAQKPVWPVTVWLMLAWAATVLFLMSRFVVTQRRFQKSLRDKKLLDDPVFYPQGMHKKRVNVYACQNISTPAVCGFFRPIILFPDEMLRRLSEEQLRWVLLHELAHIRRRDLQTAFLQRLAVMLHFYNPAVWVASYFMNHLRESACDDMALAADATIPRKKIGDALLSIVEHGAVVDRPIRGALGAFDFASSVRHRLVRLLDKKRILHTKTGVGSMILLILTTVLLVPQWQAMPPMNAATENVVAE
ncbi:MAG: M56 family metallopeptidase, partial [Planctomycetaceae bacterium]|nr:M56 family metallopeptidase [Planctomycetaceae bacterium]